MKKLMSLLFSLLILQVQSYQCLGQNISDTNYNTGSLSIDDVDAVLKKGKKLFDDAHYEEAIKEFLIVAQSNDAPQEDRIKSRYFLMRIYRAYGEDEKAKNEIVEILKLDPNYTPSSREPASIKKLFAEVKEKLTKEQSKKDEIALPSMLKENITIFEHSLVELSSNQENLNIRINKVEKELKKLKTNFYITSSTFFLLLAVGVGFK